MYSKQSKCHRLDGSFHFTSISKTQEQRSKEISGKMLLPFGRVSSAAHLRLILYERHSMIFLGKYSEYSLELGTKFDNKLNEANFCKIQSIKCVVCNYVGINSKFLLGRRGWELVPINLANVQCAQNMIVLFLQWVKITGSAYLSLFTLITINLICTHILPRHCKTLSTKQLRQCLDTRKHKMSRTELHVYYDSEMFLLFGQRLVEISVRQQRRRMRLLIDMFKTLTFQKNCHLLIQTAIKPIQNCCNSYTCYLMISNVIHHDSRAADDLIYIDRAQFPWKFSIYLENE